MGKKNTVYFTRMHTQSSGMLTWKPQRSPNTPLHTTACLQQLALLILPGLREFMLVFCGVLSSVCSPGQVLMNIKTNTVSWVKSQLDNSRGSGEKHFGSLSPHSWLRSPASPQHLLHTAMTIFSLLVHAAKQISPLGQTLSQPEMLHMLLKHPQKPFSDLSDWPKPMGPTPSAGINQPGAWSEKSEENQVTPIKPHLYFRSGLHNLMSSI